MGSRWGNVAKAVGNGIMQMGEINYREKMEAERQANMERIRQENKADKLEQREYREGIRQEDITRQEGIRQEDITRQDGINKENKADTATHRGIMQKQGQDRINLDAKKLDRSEYNSLKSESQMIDKDLIEADKGLFDAKITQEQYDQIVASIDGKKKLIAEKFELMSTYNDYAKTHNLKSTKTPTTNEESTVTDKPVVTDDKNSGLLRTKPKDEAVEDKPKESSEELSNKEFVKKENWWLEPNIPKGLMTQITPEMWEERKANSETIKSRKKLENWKGLVNSGIPHKERVRVRREMKEDYPKMDDKQKSEWRKNNLRFLRTEERKRLLNN